jgi:hypothetical protein
MISATGLKVKILADGADDYEVLARDVLPLIADRSISFDGCGRLQALSRLQALKRR